MDNLNLEIDITMEDPIALAGPWVAETPYCRRAPASSALSEISRSGDYLDFSSFESFLEDETDWSPRSLLRQRSPRALRVR